MSTNIRVSQGRSRVEAIQTMVFEARVMPSFDGSVPYRGSSVLLVPRRSGVYLVHDLRGVLYVGESAVLRGRFHQHLWEEDNPLLAAATSQPMGALKLSWVVCPEKERFEQE